MVCGVLLPCASNSAIDSRTERQAESADQLLRSVLASDGGPGIMATVIKDGEVIWRGAAGIAELEHAIPMTVEHRLRIGSVSKPVTAALTLRMVQLGKFDLSADVSSYVAEFPRKEVPITPLQLASHTSGIRHFDFANYAEANNVMYRQTLAEAIVFFANDPLVSAPGEAFLYSSHGYNLLGAALEKASGNSFTELLEKYLAGPLTLEKTRTDHPFEIVENRAGFYTVTAANHHFSWMKDGELINTIIRDSSDYYPSGGLLSSTTDLAVFTYQLFVGDFLNDEMKLLVMTPARLNNGDNASCGGTMYYSVGWEVRTGQDGVKSFGHNGETNGAYALIRYFPDENLIIAGIANYNVVGREPAFFEAIAEQLPEIFTLGN